ncbi:putative quinol monooxygenase [Marinomonas communis]|uniref:Quinol monooxygenase YgiN n=1 Tax=Marinomonas communis TaxID=28254 RepID=A0A4R6X3V3_9GAMM|nr:antibiotic biosynthesis monooxygenase [Marinomonas communis]TDR12439.1 quinol monooxygenase YgiN [Marinomonas communis]
MPKVTLKGFILVPESELELVQAELVNHTRFTLEEAGCITFSVTQNPDNPLRFDVYEEFADKESFELHQKRVKASHWGKVTVNVERHYEILE